MKKCDGVLFRAPLRQKWKKKLIKSRKKYIRRKKITLEKNSFDRCINYVT